MRAEVFLDTAYAIALSSPTDLFHQRTVQLADELKSAGDRFTRIASLPGPSDMWRQHTSATFGPRLCSHERDSE